ncbi:MAG: hypothetical protein KDA49_04060 [Rhodospirillaceae bacterium]|nr:hypothetical protein [Rhodospirillaceae bacterium]
MAKLKSSQLQLGDIILTAGNGIGSKVIRLGTASDVSHAMLFAGSGSVIHAVSEGVREQSLESVLTTVTLAKVYRLTGAKEESLKAAVAYARAQIGKKYDAFEAIGAADPERLAITPLLLMSHPIVRALPIAVFIFKMHNVFAGDREKFFCSELVVAAYQDAGLTVFDGNPSEFSPDNLKHTKLSYMGELELG